MLTELAADAELLAALAGSHSPSYRAQAFYGTELTLEDVPLDGSGSITYDIDGQIQASGNAYITRDSDGTSLVPRSETDPLAPYGQEIVLSRHIVAGEQDWLIPCGRFPIKSVPDMREYFRARPGIAHPDADALASQVVVAYDLQLKLTDRFDWIRGANFLQPEAPKAGNTTWQEIQRISPIPIVVSLPDQPLPAALAYTDSRYDAIVTLMDNLGGEPALTRTGALTARVKDPWLTETVEVFDIDGTIDVSEAMDSEGLYNAVRVRSSNGDSEIVAYAQIDATGHPLRVGGPFNGGAARVYTFASPLIDTQAKADAAALTVLARVSTQQARRVKVTITPNHLLEIGDYGRATDHRTRRWYTGSIARQSMNLDPFADMDLELIVAESGDLSG